LMETELVSSLAGGSDYGERAVARQEVTGESNPRHGNLAYDALQG
jgi:hypothetical protein